jgi:hypothetical protein
MQLSFNYMRVQGEKLFDYGTTSNQQHVKIFFFVLLSSETKQWWVLRSLRYSPASYLNKKRD